MTVVSWPLRATRIIWNTRHKWMTDIYVRARNIGSPTTTLVSVNSLGMAAGDNHSFEPRISRDGSRVAFSSYASDLDGTITDSNTTCDVFVRDWQAATPTTRLVSRSRGGSVSGDNSSSQAELSDNGSRLVFMSQATDLVAGIVDVNGASSDIFAFDSTSVALVTRKGAGVFTGTSGVNSLFDLSDTGQYVAFSTSSPGMVADGAGGNMSTCATS